jgi:hypothetical protein
MVREIGESRKWDMLLAAFVTLIGCSLFGCAAMTSGPTTKEDEPSTKRSGPRLPTTEADISGTITEVRRIHRQTDYQDKVAGNDPDTPTSSDDESRSGSSGTTGALSKHIGVVLIEENPDEEVGSQKDSMTITRVTKLMEQRGQDLSPIRLDDIEVGQRAEAWYTGPVAESYPRQATASLIVIHPPAE